MRDRKNSLWLLCSSHKKGHNAFTGLTLNIEYFSFPNFMRFSPPKNSVTVFLSQKIFLPSVHGHLTSYLVRFVSCIFNLVTTFVWIKQRDAKSGQTIHSLAIFWNSISQQETIHVLFLVEIWRYTFLKCEPVSFTTFVPHT